VAINRRDLLKLGGVTIGSSMLGQALFPLKVEAEGKPKPRGTARNCIFIALSGCISPPDTWDFKESHTTPKDFDVQKITSDLYLPKALFPNAQEWGPKVAMVRSMHARELVHFTGQYHTQTGRALNLALGKEIPAFGTVIAAELESQRRESDSFPTYVSTSLSKNRVTAIGSGFFGARYAGVDLDPAAVFDVFGSKDSDTMEILARRFRARAQLAQASPVTGPVLGEKGSAFKDFYDTAFSVLNDRRWANVFALSPGDEEYVSDFGRGCLLARNLLAADAGTRFVYVCDNSPWDHHSYIYDRTKASNLYTQCQNFDRNFTKLLTDLEARPGHEAGKTLLDETLVLATSEFGRVPYLNAAEGRDHYGTCYSTLYAGGGVKAGRVIGKTNEDCSEVIDLGWSHKLRPFHDNNVATIYSALGIDYTKSVQNAPSGRAYQYVQTAPVGGSEYQSNEPFDELFA
jgi:hypothetical protein